ncbi:MAG: D-galactarate dehydratase [Rhizobium sp.]|nr:MAG: D-galactarate dehydratase [Rhizobium sp.]
MSSTVNAKAGWTAIRIDPSDNVAVALTDLKNLGEVLDDNQCFSITLNEPIAMGHKFSVVDISKGDPVVKYGEIIGRANKHIAAGSLVHVHNVASRRAAKDI